MSVHGGKPFIIVGMHRGNSKGTNPTHHARAEEFFYLFGYERSLWRAKTVFQALEEVELAYRQKVDYVFHVTVPNFWVIRKSFSYDEQTYRLAFAHKARFKSEKPKQADRRAGH